MLLRRTLILIEAVAEAAERSVGCSHLELALEIGLALRGCGDALESLSARCKEDAEMAASLEDYARSNYWFIKHVEPVRKAMGYQ